MNLILIFPVIFHQFFKRDVRFNFFFFFTTDDFISMIRRSNIFYIYIHLNNRILQYLIVTFEKLYAILANNKNLFKAAGCECVSVI